MEHFESFRNASESEQIRLREIGFKWGDKGTHTSRTIMLDEIRAVLSSCKPDASRRDYLESIIEDNCLGKRTVATRKLSSQRLSELYALDPKVSLFKIMRRCWYSDREGQPILALLLSLARDPLLRASAQPILDIVPGEELSRQTMTNAIKQVIKDRLNESILDKVVRNAASSWTQSGHLEGRGRKYRSRAKPTAASAFFALLLANYTGSRGSRLFESSWAKVLDAPAGEILNLAMDAKRLGFLDLSQAGGVTDLSFSRFLTAEERL